MNGNNSFSNRKMFIDNNVWLVMLVTIVLCTGLLGYRLIEKRSCRPFSVYSRGLISGEHAKYKTGETVILSTSLAMDREVSWNFGDGSERERSVSPNMRHKFMKEGIYMVRASVNGGCSNEVAVAIEQAANPEVSGEDKNIRIPKIYGDSFPKAGQQVKFLSDMVGSAYEWRIINKSTFPISYEQSASFTFPKAGFYVLQLTVNHNRRMRNLVNINVSEDVAKIKPAILIPDNVLKQQKELQLQKDLEDQKKIDDQKKLDDEKKLEDQKKLDDQKMLDDQKKLEDQKRLDDQKKIDDQRRLDDQKKLEQQNELNNQKKPDDQKAPPPASPKLINIRAELFQSKLEGVVSGANDVQDFDAYLPNRGETIVWVNDDKRHMTFKELCDEIKNQKKIVIESVELKRAEDNQIQQIRVKYHKKGLPFIK